MEIFVFKSPEPKKVVYKISVSMNADVWTQSWPKSTGPISVKFIIFTKLLFLAKMDAKDVILKV